jgi:hypothetical protein
VLPQTLQRGRDVNRLSAAGDLRQQVWCCSFHGSQISDEFRTGLVHSLHDSKIEGSLRLIREYVIHEFLFVVELQGGIE